MDWVWTILGILAATFVVTLFLDHGRSLRATFGAVNMSLGLLCLLFFLFRYFEETRFYGAVNDALPLVGISLAWSVASAGLIAWGAHARQRRIRSRVAAKVDKALRARRN